MVTASCSESLSLCFLSTMPQVLTIVFCIITKDYELKPSKCEMVNPSPLTLFDKCYVPALRIHVKLRVRPTVLL